MHVGSGREGAYTTAMYRRYGAHLKIRDGDVEYKRSWCGAENTFNGLDLNVVT
jgi:hypothetical protein